MLRKFRNLISVIFAFLKKFFKKLFLHHRRYRIFALLVWTIFWGSLTSGNFFGFILTLFFLVLVSLGLTLYICDKQFRKDMYFVVSPWVKSARQQKKEDEKSRLGFRYLIFGLVWIGMHLLEKLVSFLTRFPLLDNLFENSLVHYQNRDLLKFFDKIEPSTVGTNLRFKGIDQDQYYAYFYFKEEDSKSTGKAKECIYALMKKMFPEKYENIIFKSSGRLSSVLQIPREYLSSEN